MAKREFKVGDRVRVRRWDDMEAEFGLCDYVKINTSLNFTPSMSRFCGKSATITAVNGNRVWLEFYERNLSVDCGFSTDMIEHIDESADGPEKFWFVWNPNVSAPKYKHGSEEAAKREAARLAGMNPGQEFIVLESVCSCEAKPAEFTDHVEPEIPF